jgi:hypothetical protein
MLSGLFSYLSLLKLYNLSNNKKIDLVNGQKRPVRRPKIALRRTQGKIKALIRLTHC